MEKRGKKEGEGGGGEEAAHTLNLPQSLYKALGIALFWFQTSRKRGRGGKGKEMGMKYKQKIEG